MQVVRQRQERVAPPPLHGVRGLEAADQKAVEESREGLWVEASKGTGGTEVVERGGHRGSARVLKGHPGWVLDSVPRSGEASGGGRPGRWGGRGRSGTALEDVISSFPRRCGGLLVVRRYVQVCCTGSFPLFLFLFPLFSYLPFHLVRGGAVDWGAGERGAPV